MNIWLKFLQLSLVVCLIVPQTLSANTNDISASKPNAAPLTTVDTLIVGGKVLDGSGNPWAYQDIGISGERITFIGDADSHQVKAKRVIKANGLYVTPGFIDMHSHAEPGHPEARKMLPQLYQGVTTVVLGVDGQGNNDVAQQYAEYIAHGIGANVASYVGFNAARQKVLGMSADAPTPAQLKAMQQFIERGMQEGAFGISSGLFYRPATYASTEEVISVASIARKYNGVYDTHDRDMGSVLDGIGYDASVAEAIDIGEKSGNRVIFSHFTPQGRHNYGRADIGVKLINNARLRGVDVVAAQHPYIATRSSLLAYTLPDWALAGGIEQLFNRLTEPKTNARIREDSKRMLNIRGGAEKLMFADADPELNGKTLKEVAEIYNLSVFETVIKIVRAQNDASVMNIGLYDMNNIRLLATQEWMMTSTDGGSEPAGDRQGHPRDFAAFTKKIRKFVVDEKLISLPFAIRGMTSLPSQFLGIADRGRLTVGHYADINIFNLAKLKDKATYENSQQYSEGLEYVLINGQIALEKGKATTILAGKPLIRHQHLAEQEPTEKHMLEMLRNAFGGKELLTSIDRFSTTLTTINSQQKVKVSRSYFDFSNKHVAQSLPELEELYLRTPERSEQHKKGEISALKKNKQNQLSNNMDLNFLSFLRSDELRLLGPLDIPEHRDQSWWIMNTGDLLSPAIGLDRDTGHIRKVLFDDGRYILESDYRPLENGIQWPHKFRLMDKKEVVFKGEYSEMNINAKPQFDTPSWFNIEK